ncbi:MFS transporter [Gellertiella hungarica]|uniref:MFS family permease n=1 Tax=Gellertiella hungarica TaxID=1572859 RepID=A0A7W6J7G8_9HYPH|nr:MFS transporter [Gellertiella hungarica]MBB4066223.1 MFS family permease [Gellertiella hungarica]
MFRHLPPVFLEPTVRVTMLAILAFGFSGAATSPYQSVVGIRELGLGNGTYSALIFVASIVNVTASIVLGNLADRIGSYRRMMLGISAVGILAFGLVYAVPTQAVFVASLLLLLPLYGALYSLLFANVRSITRDMNPEDIATVNSGARAMISVAWIAVPGITGLLLARSPSMLPAYLYAALACSACFALIHVLMPREGGGAGAVAERLSHLAALGEVLSPRVFVRLTAIALICGMLHMNGMLLPLILTGSAQGEVADIGFIVGIVALLEVIFIFAWARLQRRMGPVRALAFGSAVYAAYLAALGWVSAPWQVYALTIVSGFGAAAIITIPITYLQDLIAERPGLGSALISVNTFVSSGLSALLFAAGTGLSSYPGTAILSSLAGAGGVGLLLFLERRA